MDPQAQFCPNLACKARGQIGAGNIRIHCRKDGRYYCLVCKQRFAGTTDTMFYGLHHPSARVILVLTLLANGCPLRSIVVAFRIDPRTVATWLRHAGTQCQRVHEQSVVLATPHDLGQVQADEIHARAQRGVWRLAMAIAYRPVSGSGVLSDNTVTM